jgi:hypothetical protein
MTLVTKHRAPKRKVSSRAKPTEGSGDWRDMLNSLAAAKAAVPPGTGAPNLVNALVFASRCAATDHPRWIDAQTATTELVEEIAGLVVKRTVSAKDVGKVVDYIMDIGELDGSPQRRRNVSETHPQDAIALQHMRALDYIRERLVKLEKNLGNDIGTTENARLLHRSIEATKHWKQPEYSDRFGSAKEDGA